MYNKQVLIKHNIKHNIKYDAKRPPNLYMKYSSDASYLIPKQLQL